MDSRDQQAVRHLAGGGSDAAAMGAGGRTGLEICSVTKLQTPECSCPRCFERLMKPKVEALLSAGAGSLRIADVAVSPGFLNGAGTLTEQDVRDLALLEESEWTTRETEVVW